MSRSTTGARAEGSAGAHGSTEERAATAGEASGSHKYVYEFSEGSRELRDLLGGKGAGLAEMARVLPTGRVPSGFTITTEACIAYLGGAAPDALEGEVDAALARLESSAGRRLGDPNDPLLVSVRSGARVSMPGMMDTVLNLGLTDRSVEGLARRTENPRFAWDSYRRFCQMFGNVVRGVDGSRFEALIAEAKRGRGVELDTGLGGDDLRRLAARFRSLVEDETASPIPSQPREQLREAIEAVFSSWNNRRATEYRRLEGIPDDWGTAVTVQEMVFGNTGPDSGSGVAFSRDSVTGAETPSGDFLFNAQGEDVVAGARNPCDLEVLRERLTEVHRELLDDMRLLERHYRDMQDVEFTVEDGRLYMLQTRAAKRPAQAAVRFACDAVAEGLLTEEAALRTIDANRLETLLHPTFDPDAEFEVLARGVAASPGAARGAIVFSATDAVEAAGRGQEVILVRPFTEADDVAGFAAAQGILTSEGGRASHAALVARGMGKPCVSGAGVQIDPQAGTLEADGQRLGAGDVIAIDGSAGVVTRDPVEFVEPRATEELDRVLGWADDVRRLGVRANADTPDDAKRAIGFGAEGIGLCRTEHMFFGEDRDQLVRDLFLAVERRRRALAATPSDLREVEAAERESEQALDGLRRLQRSDFERILETMDGRPVTIRLLDPPLHEFLSAEFHRRELAEIEEGGDESAAAAARDRLELVEQLSEVNPMLGTRGSRLGILYPEIYEMQVGAILGAALATRHRGTPVALEIMLPLIAYEQELIELRALVERVASAALAGDDERFEYGIGTMIELPRACLVADRIAPHADFFSFGTNDLTQTTIGFSRDDVEGRFLGRYLERGILDRSPFETIDAPGVGELVRIGAERGRSANPELALGVCGEHGGDPASIGFFATVGVDYVSCSPARIPVARLAAAQAALDAEGASA